MRTTRSLSALSKASAPALVAAFFVASPVLAQDADPGATPETEGHPSEPPAGETPAAPVEAAPTDAAPVVEEQAPAPEATPEPAPEPKTKRRAKKTAAPEVAVPIESSYGEEQPDTSRDIDADRIFAEDWWTHTRPALEIHGYFRTRADLFSQFSLGRIDPPGSAMWPRPLDDYYQDVSGSTHGAEACTPQEAGTGSSTDVADANRGCSNSTQAGANLRFRVEPTIIISDNLRIRSQIDFLDNLVMGSTAQGYSNYPDIGGYAVGQRSGYYPVSGESWTQNPPVSGVNSLSDSVHVKRAWAEYETPVGQVRFGRMPDHFGLGLLHNAGDDIDGDQQSTVDRIMVSTGLPSIGLHGALAWDFPYEGATSQAFVQEGKPAYDLAQFDDVSALNLMLFRRVDPQLERRILARDGVVISGGLYLTYAFQRIANDRSGPSSTCANGAAALDCQPGESAGGYVRRGMDIWTPDLYAEVKYKKFRFGTEVVTRQGTYQSVSVLSSTSGPQADANMRVNQWGFAAEASQLFIEDRLKIGLNIGYASGDADVDGLVPGLNGMQPQNGDNTISTFRFHPGYRVDMILNRHILSRVQGSYYIKPTVQYDFFREANGMRLGGRAEAIWTRASQFMQTPGHQPDLGIELNATAYYQAKDGSLNDDPSKLGGFFAMIQYGVLFPMGGLGYLSNETTATGASMPGLQTAQNVRLFLGVAY